MMMVAVTKKVNSGDDNTKDIVKRCFQTYALHGAAVQAPPPVVIVVIGVGCVVIDSADDVPAEKFTADLAKRHPKPPPGSSSKDKKATAAPTSSKVQQAGSTADEAGPSSGKRTSLGGTEGSAQKTPKNQKGNPKGPTKMKVHEVLKALDEEDSPYCNRPFIVVGMTCIGRSVSVRGGDRVITHIIATPAMSTPSCDLSQLVMRGAGQTRDKREGLNHFMGGIKVSTITGIRLTARLESLSVIGS